MSSESRIKDLETAIRLLLPSIAHDFECEDCKAMAKDIESLVSIASSGTCIECHISQEEAANVNVEGEPDAMKLAKAYVESQGD